MESAARLQAPQKPTLSDFFARLTQAAVDYAASHNPDKATAAKLNTLASHARILKLEAESAPEMRALSVIRSSWAVVDAYGREFGFFGAFHGEPELRRTLVEFLNSGMP